MLRLIALSRLHCDHHRVPGFRSGVENRAFYLEHLGYDVNQKAPVTEYDGQGASPKKLTATCCQPKTTPDEVGSVSPFDKK
jgi:hypothetical protein